MLILSFDIKGDFASFRDPSITSNQTVYYIPSKSSVLGIIGAIIGVERSHSFKQQFSESYLELLKQTWIGLELLSYPKKIIFYSNHRSLKESKTKPFKKEVLQYPNYRIYVQINSENILNDLYEKIKRNTFEYSPYLGHAYCPAQLHTPVIYSDCIEEKLMDNDEEEYKFKTFSVILDESENYQPVFEMDAQRTEEESSIIIERHLHHFFQNGKLQQRVLKFWIPVNSKYRVTMNSKPYLCKIIKLENDSTICLY
jgi:CRISPR-associated protein Cas5 subtype I-B